MFTGLVETIGTLRRRSGGPAARSAYGASVRGLFESKFGGPLVLGESIAVNGVCLTVDRILDGDFEADMSEETLTRTTLGDLVLGSRVHLERATPVGGRLGGHIVAGHVDGVGRVAERAPRGDTVRLAVRVPPDLAPFLAAKGSVAVDGVSLTMNAVTGAPGDEEVTFEVMVVPHTLATTLLGDLRAGDRVNIEVDVLARYVARWLEFRGHQGAPAAAAPHDDERLLQKLRSSGYL
jgi:riboflavin synthase